MILAAGLTPAWQQIIELDCLRPGEVNRARQVRWCSSGKVLNVAVALAHLRAEAQTIALVGGEPRELIDREFSSLGISRQWITAQRATRICTTILDRSSGRTTELVENAGPATSDELENFARAYAQQAAAADVVVLTGSLPAGTESTFYRDLLAHTAGQAILDVRGPELLYALERRPFLVKPNREELEATLNRPLGSDAHLFEAMQHLRDCGAQWVVVTQGAEPVWVAGPPGFYRLTTLAVERVVNPIGSGDCLAAGIAAALVAGEPLLDAVCNGISAAADNVRQLLPGRLDPERVVAGAGRITIEAL